MSNELNNIRAERIRSLIFILRILTLFFCASPIFQSIFRAISSNDAYYIRFFSVSVAFSILSIITFLWLTIDKRKTNNKVISILEMVIFFGFCAFAVFLSGSHESSYKFLFIFIIVAYTIEYNMKTGLIIAGCSSAYILFLDLLYQPDGTVNIYFENDIALTAMFFIVAWALGHYVRLERNHIDTLINFVNRDGLTDLYNHRYFNEYIINYFEKENVDQKPISLIMMDIDGFKKYNNVFGHQQGDIALRIIADILSSSCKNKFIPCRYGGGEFGIILPGYNKEQATEIAANLKNKIDSYSFEVKNSLQKSKLTISAGVSESMGNTDSTMALIERADSALYRAKFLSNSKVEIFASVFDKLASIRPDDLEIIDAMKPVRTLITAINSRDRYTYSHVERVVLYCEKFCNYIDMDFDNKRKLICAAYLHDLGKVNISKELLISEKAPTDKEWELLKKHPADSAKIISEIPEIRELMPLVRSHHERYDGGGYPDGLKGEDIPYLTRIITLADSFDAMTHHRPYKKIKTEQEAFEDIRTNSGTQFDPELTEIFIEAMEKSDKVTI